MNKVRPSGINAWNDITISERLMFRRMTHIQLKRLFTENMLGEGHLIYKAYRRTAYEARRVIRIKRYFSRKKANHIRYVISYKRYFSRQCNSFIEGTSRHKLNQRTKRLK